MHSTLRPTVPPAVIDSMVAASLGAWNTINTSVIDYWAGAFSRRATPLDLMRDLTRWNVALAARQRPPWAHEAQQIVVGEWPLALLRDYSAPDADPTQIPTVILPPQAGHASSIVDFAQDQSQIMVGRENGCSRIYSMEWIGATQETKDSGIDDYMVLLREVSDQLGGKINLIGDCQGGWLATIFTALHPDRVNSLAIAGAPIDFHAGEPLIHDWLTILAPEDDMSYFRSAVSANHGVLPGRFLLDGFKALQPDQGLSRSLQLLTNMHDADYVERHRTFEDWFQWTQDIPGEFYLWIVEHLFIRNSLIKGELRVEGQTVDLKNIRCPLFLMAGRTDHITPADQVWALADYVSTPPERIGRQSASSGHLGLFMSHEALAKHWPVIFAEMGALSTPTLEDDPEVLTDEPSQTQPTMFEEVPVTQVAAPKTATVKAAAPKAAAVKAAAPKAKTAKAAVPKTATAKAAAPNAKTAKAAAAKAAAPKVAAPKAAAPKAAAPKTAPEQAAAPKAAAPKAAAPKAAAPKAAAPKAATTPAATSSADTPTPTTAQPAQATPVQESTPVQPAPAASTAAATATKAAATPQGPTAPESTPDAERPPTTP